MMNLSVRQRDVVFYLVALGVVILFNAAAAQLDAVGFPTDDSWIHQVYARNLAERGEWAFVPGKASVASTAPMYTVALAVGHLINLSPVLWANILGVILLGAAGGFTARITERIFPYPWVGLGSGLVVILSWQMIWAAASGMDVIQFIGLALALIYLTFWEHDPARSPADRAVILRGIGFGILGGCLTLTRPEGILTVGIMGLVCLFTFGWSEKRRYLIWSLSVALSWAVVVTPYVAWNYHVIGELLPSTAEAKITQYGDYRDHSLLTRYLLMGTVMLLGSQILSLPGVAWGMFALAPRQSQPTRQKILWFAPMIWGFAHLTLYVVQLPIPNQNGRYVMPVIPILWIYGVGGIADMITRSRSIAVGRVISTTLALSMGLSSVGFLWYGSQAYAKQVQVINREFIEMAEWIDTNIPPDSGLFASHDIGALGYFAPRDLVDIAGLASPEMIPIINNKPAVMAHLCAANVRWLMALPEQRPAPLYDPRLQKVHESPYTYFDSLLGNTDPEVLRMSVYEIDCSRSP